MPDVVSVDDAWHRAVVDHLDSWGIEASACALVSKSENLVYRIHTDDDSFALRLHRPGYHDRAELVAEYEWLRALRGAGCSVPEPLVARNGDPLQLLGGEGGEERFVTVSRWVEGDLLGDVLKPAPLATQLAYMRDVGRSMARLHVATDAWRIPDGFERVRWNALGLLGDQPIWGRFWQAGGLSNAEEGTLLAARDKAVVALDRLSSSFGLIHADMHPYNVVATDTGLHLIDFDDSGFGWRAYDVAIALYNFREEPSFAELSAAFVDGYAQLAEVPPALDVELFMTIRSLVWLGWVADRPELFTGDRRRDAVALVIRDASAFLG